jgi:uncharacterized protein YjbI with pentapeptide repeats
MIEALRLDVSRFNHRWGGRGVDLTGADLRGLAVDGADLAMANLSGADLGGARLLGCDLRCAALIDARLDGARLDRCNLRRARLAARGDGVHLVDCHMGDAELGPLAGKRWKLTGLTLRFARIAEIDLDEVELERVNLGGAVLGRVRLAGRTASQIDAAGATIDELRWAFALSADLDLRGARLDRLVVAGGAVHRLDLSDAAVARLEGEEAMLLDAQWRSAAVSHWRWTRCAGNGVHLRHCRLGHVELGAAEIMALTWADTAIERLDLGDARIAGAHFARCTAGVGTTAGLTLWVDYRVEDSPSLAALAPHAAAGCRVAV